jgi:hypothetical protein
MAECSVGVNDSNRPGTDERAQAGIQLTPPWMSIATGLAMVCVGVLAAVFSARGLRNAWPEYFESVLTVWITGALLFLLLSMLELRVFLAAFPLKHGRISNGSAGEFSYCVYMLYTIFIFHWLHSDLIPFPFKIGLYKLLGAELGAGLKGGAIILDPPLVTVGKDVVLGYQSLLSSHITDGITFTLAPVIIKDNALIGARAFIMPGVTVGEGAIVAANAVVTQGTTIGPGEVWGGVPARFIKHKQRG